MSKTYIYIALEDLPEDGWINGCIICCEPTSRIEKKGKYDVHICVKCKKQNSIIKNKLLYDLLR